MNGVGVMYEGPVQRMKRDPLGTAFMASVVIQVLGLFFSIALSSLAFAAAGILFLALGFTRRELVLRPIGLEYVFLAYVTAVVAMIVFAEYQGLALSNSRRVLLIAVAYFVPAAFSGERALRAFVVSLAAVAMLQSIADIVVYYSASFARLGFFQHYMTSAGMKMFALLFALPLAFRSDEAPSMRAFLAAAIVVVLFALLLTQTRSSWLGFLAGALFIGVVAHRSILAGLVVLLVLFVLFAPVSFTRRAQQMFTTSSADTSNVVQSNNSRVRMWSTGWRMFLDRPLFGVGDGDLGRVYRRYVPDAGPDEGGHLHSTYVHILASHGAVGFLAMLALFAMIGRLEWRAFRARRGSLSSAAALGALAAFLAFLVNGFAEYNFGDHEILVLLWTGVGIAATALRVSKTLPAGGTAKTENT